MSRNPTITVNNLYRFLALGFILFFLGFYITHPVQEHQYGPKDDEGYYYRYAYQLMEDGPRALRGFIEWFEESEEAKTHPPPSRIGYLYLITVFFQMFGVSYSTIGFLSSVCFLLFIFMSYYFCKKFYDQDKALLLTLFLSSSPLILGMSRRALSDAPAALLGVLSIWIFLDFLIHRQKWKYAVFVITFSCALMIRESSIMFLPFFLMASMLHKYVYKNTLPYPYMIGIIFWPAFIVVGSYTVILNSGEHLFLAIKSSFLFHLTDNHPHPFKIWYSGPWYKYIIDYFLLMPLTILLAIGYLFHLLISKEWEWKNTYFTCYLLSMFAILNIPNYKVIRFAISLEMVIGLFAILVLYQIFQKEKHNTYIYASSLVLALFNFHTFHHIFYLYGVLEPLTRTLLILQKVVPWD